MSRYKATLAPETDGFKNFISCYGVLAEDVYLGKAETIADHFQIPMSEIFYYSDTQQKQCIIQFNYLGTRSKYQIILKNSSNVQAPGGNGDVMLVYSDSANIQEQIEGESLIGFENETETSGLAYLNNGYARTASRIKGGMTLLISTKEPLLNQNIAAVPFTDKQYVLPRSLVVHRTYPNPFIANTLIEYYVPASGNVALIIYNSSGKVIKEIINQVHGEGRHSSIWDGTGQHGRRTGAGVYITQVTFCGITSSCQLLKIGK